MSPIMENIYSFIISILILSYDSHKLLLHVQLKFEFVIL
jgi:hypothetical protein